MTPGYAIRPMPGVGCLYFPIFGVMKLEDYIFIGMCIFGVFCGIGFYQAVRDVGVAIKRGRTCFIKCESGRWVAWYEYRDDIIANGDTKKECYSNLKILYKSAIKHELMENKVG